VNTIINLEYGWYIRGCCRQWQNLAKRYLVIVLAWGAAWLDCRPVSLRPRSGSCSGAAVSVRRRDGNRLPVKYPVPKF